MKICSRCKVEVSKDLFGKDKRSKDGLLCSCKSCTNIFARSAEAKRKIEVYPFRKITIPESKVCTMCNELKLSSEFAIRDGSSDGLRFGCKPCMGIWFIENRPELLVKGKIRYDRDGWKFKEIKRNNYKDNPAKYKLSSYNYYWANPGKCNAASRKYNAEHAPEIKIQHSKNRLINRVALNLKGRIWQIANPAIVNAACAQRHAAKKLATPIWKDSSKIILFYERSIEMFNLTGEKHNVDHMVPLQSSFVCGLHCEFNLQVITRTENISKLNRWWPDMWTEEDYLVKQK